MNDSEDREEDRPARNEPPRHDARSLIGPDRTARIMLDGTSYTLRITRAGKLILTK
ncbi:hemin uptake protein HemP [Meridianimarinicoccus sp. RP-17]|uniref:hemin uptake protein HemP n=1 Tax=Meridianimarinicoccus zhengii TaxID=2056810 RepID=UPI000DAB8E84|nr:hemin uptake protein HemP [Phycocomes zhengii]